ncbi:MAG: glycoside hydrolase family 3 N-terminal domain-containing protein, partial [Thermoplasmatales archaeon]
MSKENTSFFNRHLPDEETISKILSSMSLEQKVAQLTSVWVYELLDGTEFSVNKARKLLKNGVGQITRIGGASNLSPIESASLYNKIQQFLLEETEIKIPAIMHEEACSGYMALNATLFPQAIGVSSAMDPGAVKDMATVISKQMSYVGAHQALAPLLDITRDARWGRMEETFGEDPYLTSQIGIAYIKGLQGDENGRGVIATGKHFAGYGFSEGGMNWAPAHIPERELREIILRPFEAAVKEAHLESIMPAYNELDGVPCHSNKCLLDQILRNEWGFRGTVVSDYFAIAMLEEYHHIAKNREEAAIIALKSGVTVELPNKDAYGEPLITAVREGLVSESVLDQAVSRVLRHKYAMNLMSDPYVDVSKVIDAFVNPANENLSLKLARESIVLLKNSRSILPLRRNNIKIAVVGPNSNNIRNLLGDYAYPCHIENLIRTKTEDNVFNQPMPEKISMEGLIGEYPTVLECVREKVRDGATVVYSQGCDVVGNNRKGIKEAVELARSADAVIAVVGDKSGLTLECTTGESRDRDDLRLPGVQEELIEGLIKTGKPIVIVLVNGRPVTGTWFENVDAIVEAWLPGVQGGRAIADVIFGDYNPGGRLTVSYPFTVGQLPTYYNHPPSGGRSYWHGDYFDGKSGPRYPFGYGLSYTEFKYISNECLLDWNESSPSKSAILVKTTVSNLGSLLGDEVVQVYAKTSSKKFTRPIKELKAFRRITIDSGETKIIKFTIPLDILSYYDFENGWRLEKGPIEIFIGSSSEDIRFTATV